ncbi:unnamed protein product [Penicillium olsonii]|uniref:Zn(2)-C6 fungal-type domain-containing protein n=1 Tax=Penicillium olsonii TaxID=99116 RepID=A0A9W4MWD6_PENOL|nr:unnamed protein product [Penicillium olsonii]
MAEYVLSDATADQQRVMRRHRARHTKSRNGCYNCKSRRVKCDELQPACGTCSSRGEPCSYPRPRILLQKPSKSRKDQTDDDSGSSMPVSWASPDECPQLGAIDLMGSNATVPANFGEPQHGQQSLAMDDLKLLQFFHLHTASRMALQPRRVMVWQRVIPEFANKNRNLMHLLLALGGIHMVIQQAEFSRQGALDDSDTVDLAIIQGHHQKGLEGFREELSCISPANADHVLAGSLLLVGYAFASLKVQRLNSLAELQQAPRSSSTNEILHLNWLYLNRGVSSVLSDQWNVLKASRLRQMVVFPHTEEFWNDLQIDARLSRLSRCSPRLLKFAEGADQAVVNLKSALKALEAPKDEVPNCPGAPTSEPSPSMTSDWILDAHFAALEILEKSYSRVLAVLRCAATEIPVDTEIQMDFEDAAILGWPVALSSPFLLSLQESEHNFLHGYSLVLLAHFYLVNTLVDTWFLQGSFEGDIFKVKSLIDAMDDNLLSTFMLWPNEVVAMPSKSTS